MKIIKLFFLMALLAVNSEIFGQDANEITVVPQPYEMALRNPLKGFTTNNTGNHPWATLAHTYFKWNELENHETDGIEKIINVCNQRWANQATKNVKVIPRVYLHWDGDKKYWPNDMQKDDYTSEQFKARLLRLIERLGICWDNDPRVAFVELGIFGKWGEHHSPSPTAAMQKIAADAFASAFKNKKVSVRHMWNEFTEQPFGEYWDSWAHYDQMWGHGNSIKKINDQNGRYKETYIGGEVAYGWGNNEIQPGASPTHSVAIQSHRDFVINSIRWLHCTQLRWISNYDQYNQDAIQGAEEIQKAFGYRYELNEVRFSLTDSLKISFDVTNTGSAPFYYKWPVEVALLDSSTLKPVWQATIDNADIRDWMPGEGWTDPEWKYVGSWQQYHPNLNWNPSKTSEWAVPPSKNRISDKFKFELPNGTYVLSLSILDPAGNLPAVKFATRNYLKGGRHPVGLIKVGENTCDTLPVNFQFDDPKSDASLYYDDEFEIVYERDPVQTPFNKKTWHFPTDTLQAWQYDFLNNNSGKKYFLLDSANTIGIYGCNDTTGVDLRLYQDSVENTNSAQFKWNQADETFQANGQWVEYTSDFKLNLPYQLLLRARKNVDANFKLSILTDKGDTLFFNDFNLFNDFNIQQESDGQTSWFISKQAINELWGVYVVKFDWYDNIGEPGIFGGFTFIRSELDVTAPEWHFVSIGTFRPGTNIVVMTTEDAKVYLVREGTIASATEITENAVASTTVMAYQQAYLSTAGLGTGNYVVFAIDSSNNISEASRLIKLQYPVNVNAMPLNTDIKINYNQTQELITISSNSELSYLELYHILGKKINNKKCKGNSYSLNTNGLNAGIYVIRVYDLEGNKITKKIVLRQ